MKYFAFLLSILFLISCDNDDSNDGNNEPTATQIETFAESGTWRISSFVDSGQDETNDFLGYSFTFNADGTIIATNGSITVNGSWSIDDSSNSSNDGDSDVDFIILFAVDPDNDFEDLNDDWDVVSASNTLLDLIDVSGGNGGTDTLTFVRE